MRLSSLPSYVQAIKKKRQDNGKVKSSSTARKPRTQNDRNTTTTRCLHDSELLEYRADAVMVLVEQPDVDQWQSSDEVRRQVEHYLANTHNNIKRDDLYNNNDDDKITREQQGWIDYITSALKVQSVDVGDAITPVSISQSIETKQGDDQQVGYGTWCTLGMW